MSFKRVIGDISGAVVRAGLILVGLAAIAVVSLVILGALSGSKVPPAPERSIRTGSYEVAAGAFFGCDTLERFKSVLALGSDKLAMQKLLAREILASHCKTWSNGDNLYIDDYAVWSHAIRVRMRGDPDFWWTSEVAVSRR